MSPANLMALGRWFPAASDLRSLDPIGSSGFEEAQVETAIWRQKFVELKMIAAKLIGVLLDLISEACRQEETQACVTARSSNTARS
jgi:hypothetical protein